MSLPHALLGLINYKPLTGYDLKSLFESSINMFWNASLPQIYRTLNQMEKSGWLQSSFELQEGKPNRRVYQITSKGTKVLQSWLSEPVGFQQAKNKMMIKVFFGNHMDRIDLINQIKEIRDQESKFLSEYEHEIKNIAKDYAERMEAKDDILFWMIAGDYGIRKARMVIEWCDSALDILN